MNDKETIERALNERGWTVKRWDEEHENGVSAVIGRFKAVEDDESTGLYASDEGDLMACLVGRSSLGNQRVAYWLSRPEYGDADVNDLSLLEPIV